MMVDRAVIAGKAAPASQQQPRVAHKAAFVPRPAGVQSRRGAAAAAAQDSESTSGDSP
jgi:hypothetical protein